MLQQTQVEQVIDYYQEFMRQFPTLQNLADADLSRVLKSWEGLGYYSRARNMHKTARLIINEYKGVFPSQKKELIKLPGIGEYTANAILSLVDDQSFSVIDGNVIRVITRLFEISDDIRQSNTLKKISLKLNEIFLKEDAAKFNESIMELGALICIPRNPLCLKCPLQKHCSAFKNNRINEIPFKSKPKPKKTLKVLSHIIRRKGKFLVAQRRLDGLLGGYWEFPTTILNDSKTLNFNKFIKHTYTHFNLVVYLKDTTYEKLKFDQELYIQKKWLLLKEMKQYPIHRAMQKVLDKLHEN